MPVFQLDLNPALVGLSMAYGITLIGRIQNCIRTSAEVENLVRIYAHSTDIYIATAKSNIY